MNGVTRQIETHLPALQRYASVLSRNENAADDLIQECLLHALTKANRYSPGTSLRAWLFTLLHNLHISDVRNNGEQAQTSTPKQVAGSIFAGTCQRSSAMRRAISRAAILQSNPLRLLSHCSDLADNAGHKDSKRDASPTEILNFMQVREPRIPGQPATAPGLAGKKYVSNNAFSRIAKSKISTP